MFECSYLQHRCSSTYVSYASLNISLSPLRLWQLFLTVDIVLKLSCQTIALVTAGGNGKEKLRMANETTCGTVLLVLVFKGSHCEAVLHKSAESVTCCVTGHCSTEVIDLLFVRI